MIVYFYFYWMYFFWNMFFIFIKNFWVIVFLCVVICHFFNLTSLFKKVYE